MSNKQIPFKVIEKYIDLRDKRDLASSAWVDEDYEDGITGGYLNYQKKQQELKGFLEALEILGYDIETLKKICKEV